MKKAKMIAAICLVAVLVVLIVLIGKFMLGMISGIRNAGNAALEPSPTEEAWVAPTMDPSAWSDQAYDDRLGASDDAFDDASDEDASRSSADRAPLAQVPVEQTPEELAATALEG
ncbi:MAG: hypothetical protein RR296_07150 [Clostridia bacterium]